MYKVDGVAFLPRSIVRTTSSSVLCPPPSFLRGGCCGRRGGVVPGAPTPHQCPAHLWRAYRVGRSTRPPCLGRAEQAQRERRVRRAVEAAERSGRDEIERSQPSIVARASTVCSVNARSVKVTQSHTALVKVCVGQQAQYKFGKFCIRMQDMASMGMHATHVRKSFSREAFLSQLKHLDSESGLGLEPLGKELARV